jgi:hypothetical protein
MLAIDALRAELAGRYGGSIQAATAGLGTGDPESHAARQKIRKWTKETGSVPAHHVPDLLEHMQDCDRKAVARADLCDRWDVSGRFLVFLLAWKVDEDLVGLISASLRCDEAVARKWLALVR